MRKRTFYHVATGLLALAAACVCARADLIALWDAGEGDASGGTHLDLYTTAPTQAVGLVHASDITVSWDAPIDPGGSVGGQGSPPSPNTYFNEPNWTGSVAQAKYFEVSLTASNGYWMNLQNFSFWHRARSSNSPTNFFIRYSVDNFASDLTSGDSPRTWTETAIGLSDPVDYGLTSVTFRIYGFNANSSGARWDVDHVSVNGEVALIPEPGSAALVAVGTAFLLLVRRRFGRR